MMEFLFLKIKQSDFWGFIPNISKTAYIETVFQNWCRWQACAVAEHTAA